MKFGQLLKKIGIILVIIACVTFAITFGVRYGLMGNARQFLAPAGEHFQPDADAFKFVVVGDTGQNTHTAATILQNVADEKPDFVIYIGDLVKYAGDKHMAHMTGVLSKHLQQLPVFMTPGNHDITARHHGPLSYLPYIHAFGATFYWFGYGDTLFIGLDSATKSIDDAQWDFLGRVMRDVRPSFKRAILFTHVPPINPDPLNSNRRLDNVSVGKMADAIKRYQMDAIFAGHIHLYSKTDFHGAPLYTTPASGQPPRGDTKEMGFLTVTVTPKSIDVIPKYINGLNTPENMRMPFVRRMVVVFGDVWALIFGAMILICGIGAIWAGAKLKKNKHR